MRFLKGLVHAPLALAVIVSAASCANEGQGERCDIRNNNDDCQGGLFCIPLTTSVGYICCPPEGSPSSSDVCNGARSPTLGRGTVDAGAQPAPTADAAPKLDANVLDAKTRD